MSWSNTDSSEESSDDEDLLAQRKKVTPKKPDPKKTTATKSKTASRPDTSTGLGLTDEEKQHLKETEAKLLALEREEKENEKELKRIMDKAKDASAKAEKHMSFREKSIKAREDKKARK
eukprot:g4097.t1